jgi:hypothetical protein
MKSICHKYKINWSPNQVGNLIGIPSDKVAIRRAAFGQAVTCQFQQVGVYVDRYDVTRDLRDLQSEPAVARAEIDHLHAGLDAYRGEYAGGVWPQCFPPSGSRHLSALEKFGKIAGHRHTVSIINVELVPR